jgi:hypothetical protein
MVLGDGHKVRFAVTQDVWQGLSRVATSATLSVSVPESLTSVQWNTVQPRSVDEAPVHEACEGAVPQEVVWRVCGACHFTHFALVRFG